ncbi:hypothetical protein E0H22_15910 [Rhodopseudomonas boonkerdii]|uniref:DUF6719 family protein n=1 Tax=Rhodopseudomonas boonkerdii TaxID=475937 RepID=UPI001E3F6C70|nr:DUF6719 family protein [Rhodopseudomonas boonkerdii]UGV27041.1 hypothetical protein E0H22_15910 [Rhodopseudomonas boonkerdii]
MRAAIAFGILAIVTTATPAFAIDQVSREDDIIDLRLGQRIWVDDGSCPTGQIKEVMGATLAANGGVARVKKCVPRSATRIR